MNISSDSMPGFAATDGGLARFKQTGLDVVAANSLDNRPYRYACPEGRCQPFFLFFFLHSFTLMHSSCFFFLYSFILNVSHSPICPHSIGHCRSFFADKLRKSTLVSWMPRGIFLMKLCKRSQPQTVKHTHALFPSHTSHVIPYMIDYLAQIVHKHAMKTTCTTHIRSHICEPHNICADGCFSHPTGVVRNSIASTTKSGKCVARTRAAIHVCSVARFLSISKSNESQVHTIIR